MKIKPFRHDYPTSCSVSHQQGSGQFLTRLKTVSSSMTSVLLSVLDFLTFCFFWGAWLQYTTDAIKVWVVDAILNVSFILRNVLLPYWVSGNIIFFPWVLSSIAFMMENFNSQLGIRFKLFILFCFFSFFYCSLKHVRPKIFLFVEKRTVTMFSIY